MQYRINEIFYSLQGEGFHTGIPSVFVRFSGCNLHCEFCDTDHAHGTLLSFDDIVREVLQYPAPWVVLTGGEPSLFIDDDFVQRLKAATGKQIAIETNGTPPLPPSLDWVTLSPKPASPAPTPIPACSPAAMNLKWCICIKISTPTPTSKPSTASSSPATWQTPPNAPPMCKPVWKPCSPIPNGVSPSKHTASSTSDKPPPISIPPQYGNDDG